MANQKIRIIVGLGNPGKEYAATRHNAGFIAVEALAQAIIGGENLAWREDKRLKAEVVEGNFSGSKLVFAKPQTFMNLSGVAVANIAQFYKIETKDIWVIHDDLDLPLGKVQIKMGGNSAGHHGLESITNELKSAEFVRVRFGIRGAELRITHNEEGIDTTEFVTSKFTSTELDVFNKVIEAFVAKAMEILETDGGLTETQTINSEQ